MLTNYRVTYTVKSVKALTDKNLEFAESIAKHEYLSESNDFSEVFTDLYYMHRNESLKAIEILGINEQ